MLILAAIPSASVALVVTRSATLGLANGAAVALGIVLGDLVFVVLALLGMGLLAETMGAFFALLKVAGGAYLIWVGIGLLRAKHRMDLHQTSAGAKVSLCLSFLSGFILTLGDVKAILFYASFFPTFVEMKTLTATDISVIVSVTIVAVGGVKLAYAVLAKQVIARMQSRRAQKWSRSAAGCAMVGAGTCLIAKGC